MCVRNKGEKNFIINSCERVRLKWKTEIDEDQNRNINKIK